MSRDIYHKVHNTVNGPKNTVTALAYLLSHGLKGASVRANLSCKFTKHFTLEKTEFCLNQILTSFQQLRKYIFIFPCIICTWTIEHYNVETYGVCLAHII